MHTGAFLCCDQETKFSESIQYNPETNLREARYIRQYLILKISSPSVDNFFELSYAQTNKQINKQNDRIILPLCRWLKR